MRYDLTVVEQLQCAAGATSTSTTASPPTAPRPRPSRPAPITPGSTTGSPTRPITTTTGCWRPTCSAPTITPLTSPPSPLMQGEVVTDVRLEIRQGAGRLCLCGQAHRHHPDQRQPWPTAIRWSTGPTPGGQYMSQWETGRAAWITLIVQAQSAQSPQNRLLSIMDRARLFIRAVPIPGLIKLKRGKQS